jgi:hypothetical protein
MTEKYNDEQCAKDFNLGYYLAQSKDPNAKHYIERIKQDMSELQTHAFNEGFFQGHLENKSKDIEAEKQSNEPEKDDKSKDNNTLDIIFNGTHDALKEAKDEISKHMFNDDKDR